MHPLVQTAGIMSLGLSFAAALFHRASLLERLERLFWRSRYYKHSANKAAAAAQILALSQRSPPPRQRRRHRRRPRA